MPQIILAINNPDDEVVNSNDISCYLISDNLSEQQIKKALSFGKMVLVKGENAIDVCNKYNLDGVVKKVDTSKPIKIQLKYLREKLRKKTLGVIIPARRHEAMLVGEVEPEFIAFYSDNQLKDKDVISWYNDLFLIPSAWIVDDNLEKANLMEVDFLIIDSKKIKNFGC